MSINPQLQGKGQFEVLAGSVTSHFAAIETILQQNECINGQYNLLTSASYVQGTPVVAPGFTRVCISSNGSIIMDLENSYITAELEYTMRWWGAADGNLAKKNNNEGLGKVMDKNPFTKYFIGFKQSLDALERYDIYVNAQQIYSQSFVGHESFVQMCGIKDEMLKKNPYVYTCYHNAATMNNNVCGVFIDLKNVPKGEPFVVEIPVKINIHQFLLLSPVHYLPSFSGRWEIELFFNSNNLITCPVIPELQMSEFKKTYSSPLLDAIYKYDHVADELGLQKGFSKRFTQINDEFYGITKAEVAYALLDGKEAGKSMFGENGIAGWKITPTVTYERLHFDCIKTTVVECLVNMTQFQLRYEVAEALRAHYAEVPLIIPTNLLNYQRFPLSDTSSVDSVHAVANLPVENVDALFILTPFTANQRTCYYQPYFSDVRMSFGEFGVKPAQYIKTFNDARFLGLTLDALNLENSMIAAMNSDFANSVMPHVALYSMANNANTNEIVYVDQRFNEGHLVDDSYFMIGLPLSQVGFQSGTMSSPISNINFNFNASRGDLPDLYNGHSLQKLQKMKINVPMVAMFLVDAEIIIQVVPNSDQPIVKVSSKSVV